MPGGPAFSRHRGLLGEELHVGAAQRVTDEDVGWVELQGVELGAELFDDGEAVAVGEEEDR